MNASSIFGPVLVQVTLTLVVFVLLGARKVAALKAGTVDLTKTALHPEAWPDPVLKVSNNLRNQSETPVLFYALCFVLFGLDAVSPLALGLAWVYALSRVAHAYVHTGNNYVPHRMRLFMVGLAAIIGLTIVAAVAMIGA